MRLRKMRLRNTRFGALRGSRLGCEQNVHEARDERREALNRLVAYLLENLILDFQGDLTLEMVRDFLRDDNSSEAKALLAKLVEDRGVSEMMIVLADCLQEYTASGINNDVMKEQIRTYAES